jgi:hypothetical protein
VTGLLNILEAQNLTTLPADVQASILSFLPCRELARFATVSWRSRAMATLDELWAPLVAQHFFLGLHVTMSKPARKFRELACVCCSICQKSLLLSESRVIPARYQRPHFCNRCKFKCCADCRCECQYNGQVRCT